MISNEILSPEIGIISVALMSTDLGLDFIPSAEYLPPLIRNIFVGKIRNNLQQLRQDCDRLSFCLSALPVRQLSCQWLMPISYPFPLAAVWQPLHFPMECFVCFSYSIAFPQEQQLPFHGHPAIVSTDIQ